MNYAKTAWIKENNLEKQIAYQCAALWFDIKLGNLLIFDSNDKKELKQLLSGTKIQFVKLGNRRRKEIYLLYHREELSCYLHSSGIDNFLVSCGYQEGKSEEMLIHLAKRYQAYCMKEKPFPHEIGVFLGYPLEDIIGFIENKGKNYLFSGYWKVYSEMYHQEKLFYYYKEARKLLFQFLESGISLKEIII